MMTVLTHHLRSLEERLSRREVQSREELLGLLADGVGSLAHARASAERGDHIVAMLALESVGHYSGAAHSQRYPWPIGLLYPDVGDFVAFVGNVGSRDLVHQAFATFREAAAFPSEGAALPGAIPGLGWSDPKRLALHSDNGGPMKGSTLLATSSGSVSWPLSAALASATTTPSPRRSSGR